MTPEQKGLVEASWAKVVPITDVAAKLFYDRLFEIDPALRALFRHTDLAQQRRKLMATLAIAVQGLEDLDGLMPAARDLGRRHAGYGVQEIHYASVGAALLWTLEQVLGQAWTPSVACAWGELYRLLSGSMQQAGA